MSFSEQVMLQWGNKTFTPKLKLRLMKAGNNWLSRKSEPIAKALDDAEITAEEAARQLSDLNDSMHYQINIALVGCSNGDPACSGSPSMQPEHKRDNNLKQVQ